MMNGPRSEYQIPAEQPITTTAAFVLGGSRSGRPEKNPRKAASLEDDRFRELVKSRPLDQARAYIV